MFKRDVTRNTLHKNQFWNASSEIQKYQTRIRLDSSSTSASCQISVFWSLFALSMAGAWNEEILDVPSYPNQSGILGWKYQLEKGNICWAVGRWGFGSIFQLQEWCWCSLGALSEKWVKSAPTYCWNEAFLGDFPPSLSLHPPNPLLGSPWAPAPARAPRNAGTKGTSLFFLLVVLKKNCCLPRNWVLFLRNR